MLALFIVLREPVILYQPDCLSLIMKYKAGQTIFMSAYDELFYYALHEDDIISICDGEWPGFGFKITSKFTEVVKCLWFAVLPSFCYERECHYDCSYWQHLKINFNYAIYILKIQKNGKE